MHSFTFKVNEEYYKKYKNVCFNIIYYICANLPCPMCRGHAMIYLNNNSIRRCNTKEEFKYYLWQFHNNVNIRLGKPVFTKEKLDELYSRCNFYKICLLFIKEFKRPYYYGRSMSSWQRKNVSNDIRVYLINNWKYFV
tara:strand:+ start:5136 stop:5549 length:414 start_codon:yes stop_codon:yes gene_type:complete